MIRTETTSGIPDIPWTDYSAFELRSYSEGAKRELIAGSKYIKLIFSESKIVMVAGLYRGALISVPYFWSLVTPDFQSLRISELRSMSHELSAYGPVETLVNETAPSAIRLARIFSFHPTTFTTEIDTLPFRMFRRDK